MTENINTPVEVFRDPFVKYQKYIAMASAVFLFFLFTLHRLDSLSSLTDSTVKGIDYFTLPRCGLALLNGSNVFTSTADYQSYGPWGSNYTSHPLLCLVFGIPLAKLSPWVGYWLMNFCYLILQLVMLQVFFSRSNKIKFSGVEKIWETVFAISSGFFMPWYTMYNQGQYHALAVLGLFLILAWPYKLQTQVGGFLLSAFAKPVLAPLAIVIFFARSLGPFRYKILIWTSVIVILGSLPFAVDWSYLFSDFRLNMTESFQFYLTNGSDYMKYAIWRWNQQQSLATVLDEFMSRDLSLAVRYLLTGIVISLSVFLVAVKNRNQNQNQNNIGHNQSIVPALALCSTWYFLMYARGHEYQWTLFLPILLCLYFENSGRYRNAWIAFLGLFLAMPNGYFIYHLIHQFNGVDAMPSSKMIEISPTAYALFIFPKPLGALLVAVTITVNELKLYFRSECSQNSRIDVM